MVIAPHDLLKITGWEDLITRMEIPEWVKLSLNSSPFVVVRRAPAPEKQIAVGVRGKSRNERFGTFLRTSSVVKHITPEQLVTGQLWERSNRYKKLEVLRILGEIEALLYTYGYQWGPTGSVGFELASGKETANLKSDLDLVIRAPKLIPIKIAEEIIKVLRKYSCAVDVQVETPQGAISLVEYARNITPIVIKTTNGPLLINNPWV